MNTDILIAAKVGHYTVFSGIPILHCLALLQVGRCEDSIIVAITRLGYRCGGLQSSTDGRIECLPLGGRDLGYWR